MDRLELWLSQIASRTRYIGDSGVFDDEMARSYESCQFSISEVVQEGPNITVDGLRPNLLARVEVGANESGIDPSVRGGGIEGEQAAFGITGHPDFLPLSVAPAVKPIHCGEHFLNFVADDMRSHVKDLASLEGPEIVVDTLAPYVVSLHAKDFLVHRSPHQMGFEITGTPAGQGSLDFPWLLRKIGEARRSPNVVLELWPPSERDLEATISKEWQWFEASIRYLRPLVST